MRQVRSSEASSSGGGGKITGSIGGPGGLTKTGADMLLVDGNPNNYTGPTVASAGILEFEYSLYGNDTSKWTPANITVLSNAVLMLNVSATEFSPSQAGTLFNGLTTVNNNGLLAGSFMGFDTVNAGATVQEVTAALTDSTGPGGGAVGLQKINANTLKLSGNNTFSGQVQIGPTGQPGGTLQVNSFNYITSGTLSPNTSSSLGHPTTVANGTIACGNPSNNQSTGLTYLGTGETTDRVLSMAAGVSGGTALTLDQSGTGLLKFTSGLNTPSGNNRTLVLQGSTTGTGELAGAITNASAAQYTSVTKSGTGTWVLSGANTYNPVSSAGGVTTVSGGCLVLNNANALPGGIGVSGGLSPLTFNGGVIGLGAGDFTRNLATNGIATGAWFSGNGGWAAYGANRIVNLGGVSATISWAATDGTGFNAKTLILGNVTADHTVDFQNPIDLGNATRTVQVDDGAAAIDAKISGALSQSTGTGNLTKTGNGTLALSGVNTYSGTTLVSAGCLLVNGTNSSTALITVNSGATNGGTGTIMGPVTYNTGAKAVFTVTPDPISSLTNLTPLTIAGKMTYNANQVVLNAPANLPSGTYILAASSSLATTNGAFPTPVLLTGSYAPSVTSATVGLDGTGMNLILTVTGLPANPTQLAIPSVNGGTSPTATVGFPVVVQSQDANGAPRIVASDTAVQLSRTSGSFLLYGTLTGTIPAGSSSVTISGVQYASADTGVVVTTTRTSGDSLTAGNSAPFNVLANTTPDHLTVTGFPSPQTAGVAGSVTVTAKTVGGSTATTYAGTVHFTSTAVSAGLPANYTFVPATDNGVRVFSGVTLNTAGTQTITATDTVTSSITGAQTGIIVTPANASALAVTGFPSPQATNVAGSVTVTAQDTYANTATNYTGTIHLTSSDSLAVLPGNYAFVGGDHGVHTFANGVTFNTLGAGQWIAATDTGTPSITGTQANITIWIFPTLFTWTNGAGGNWSAAADWTNDQAVVFAPLTNGEPNYTLSFGAGTYTATHDLADGFLLNQLNFAGAVTLNSPLGMPHSLTFTNDGLTLPQINQNGSAGAVTVVNPLNLATNLTIGGSGSGGVSLIGAISGVGSVIKTNANSALTLGTASSTYSGGTMINAGTVNVPATTANTLGSGRITLASGATFGPNGSTFTNACTLNGGTVQNGNSFSASLNGAIYLGATTTFDLQTTGNMGIGGNMSGPGGLTKIGAGQGPLVLSGTNSYLGPTTVSFGSIKYNSPAAVATGDLSISSGATVNLNYSGTQYINSLTLGEALQPNGTYGATANGAAYFTGTGYGTGTVTVGPPPVPPAPVLDPSTGFSVAGGNPTFTFSTVAGFKYRLISTDNLATPQAEWQGVPIYSPVVSDANGWVVATDISMTLVDQTYTTGSTPQRFYRIEASTQ